MAENGEKQDSNIAELVISEPDFSDFDESEIEEPDLSDFDNPDEGSSALETDESDFTDLDDLEEERSDFDWMESVILNGSLLTEQFNKRKEHLLNPEEELLDFAGFENSVEMDLEWNPKITNSLTLKTWLTFRGWSSDIESKGRLYLPEAYLQWINESKDFVINAGRVKVSWGSGYAWTPTQVLIPFYENPENDQEKKVGLPMVQMEYSQGALTMTAIVAAMRREESGSSDYESQFAARLTADFNGWEIALIHHQATTLKPTTGFSVTGLLTDNLEFHGEFTHSHGRNREIPEAMGVIPVGPNLFLPAWHRYVNDEALGNFYKMMIGGQYTFDNDSNLAVELLRTTHGYDRKEWELIQQGMENALKDDNWKNPIFGSVDNNPYAGFLKDTQSLTGKQMRQNYLFLRWAGAESENLWRWTQLFQLNLDDQSQMHRGTLEKSWTDSLTSEFSLTLFRGVEQSEFALIPYSEIAKLRVNYAF